jgi:hypothetical protein
MLTFIQPSKHVVKDTPVAKLFRRRLKFDDIITFWSGDTGEWILAYWVCKKKHLVDEMEDLGMAFEKATPELIQQVVTCWKTVDWRAKKKRLVSKERDRIRNENERIQEEQRRWDWAKRKMAAKGLKPLPYAFKSPVSGGQIQ